MSCYIYITLYDFNDCNKETNMPFGRCLPIPFVSKIEAQQYLDEHVELWSGTPMFACGTYWEPTEEDLKVWDTFCKKINIINPLKEVTKL